MRFRLTILLAVLNLIAFGTIYYLEVARSGDTRGSGDKPGILGSEILRASRISISGPSVPFGRILERENDVWQIRQPVTWRANANAVERMLSQLAGMREVASFSLGEIAATGQTLADYGLADPSLEIEIGVERRIVRLAIGNPTEIPGRFYLLEREADRIHVIDARLVEAIAIDIAELQDNRLFNFDLFALDRFSVQDLLKDGPVVRLGQVGERWFLETPIETRANGALVDARLNAILTVDITRFLVAEAAEAAFQRLLNPEMRMIFETSRSTQVLLLSEPSQQDPENPLLIARFENNPTVFEVPARPFAGLALAQDIFRHRSVIDFEMSDLDSLSVSDERRTTTIQRLESNLWEVVSVSGDSEAIRSSADPLIVADAIDALRNLRISSFVSDAPSEEDLSGFGLIQPQRRIKVVAKDTVELTLGSLDSSDQLLYARRSDEPFVFKVPLEPIRILPVNPLHYRLRLLDSLPAAATLTRIAILGATDDEPILEMLRDGSSESWVSTREPLEKEKELTAFAVLEGYAREFRVGTYLGSAIGSAISVDGLDPVPWKYRLEFDFSLPAAEADTPTRHTYLISERAGGTLQAGASRRHEVTFTLPLELVESLAVFLTEVPETAVDDELLEVDRSTETGPLLDLLMEDNATE